jgi:HEAT repeat protein
MSDELDKLWESFEQLGDQAQAIPFSMLYPLSDLTGEQRVKFGAAWPTLPASTRRRLLDTLVELTEANFQVNFDAVFRLCLDDPDAETRALAIKGLWENTSASLVGPLIAKLRADPSVQVRAAAASALGRFMLAAELEELAQPIQARIMSELITTIHLASESVEVRRRAVESVAYACTSEIHDILEVAYYDDDDRMRLSAVTGMGRSCDQRWADVILEEMDSDSPAMRYEAAWASGELMLRSSVPVLARLMHDPDHQVREASIWALGQIGGATAKDVLVDAYDDADDDTRDALGEALSELALLEGNLDLALYELQGDSGIDLPNGGFSHSTSEEELEQSRGDWDFYES